MPRQTPISISSESDSPTAATITSASDSAQTISSDRNPDVALVSEIITVPEEDDDQRSDTIQHVDSESDHLQVLEAEAETACARREEREALEKHAKARRARGSNSSARSVRSVHPSTSSARFEAPHVATIQPIQSVPIGPPALPVTTVPATVPENQPELPTAQSNWLEWFAAHAPRRHGPHTSEEAQVLSDVGGDVLQNSAFTSFRRSLHSVKNRVAELERAQTTSEHGLDQEKGVQRFLDERGWELQSARAGGQELEGMTKRQRSRTSFGSVASREPLTPPGLPATTQHSRPMIVMDPWQEWHETSVHDHVPDQRFLNPVLNPEQWNEHVQHEPARLSPAPPPPPGGNNDDSSSSSSSDDDAQKRKRKKKKGPYKAKNAEMRLPQYPNALTFQSWRRNVRTAPISACEKPERARAFVFSVGAEEASFESLAVSDSDKHRTLDAKLADALLKVVKGDLARRLAVMSFGEAWTCARWPPDPLPDL